MFPALVLCGLLLSDVSGDPQTAPAVVAVPAVAVQVQEVQEAPVTPVAQAGQQAPVTPVASLATPDTGDDQRALPARPEGDLPAPVVVVEEAPPPVLRLPAQHLLEVVPVGTASLWHRRAAPETALVDAYTREVAQAVLDTNLGAFAIDSLEGAGVDPELIRYLRSLRNTLTTVGAVVPWDDLLGEEFVWAQTTTPPFLPGMGFPSALLAARPTPERAEEVETSLAGFFGSMAAFFGSNVRYEMHTVVDDHGGETRLYRITTPLMGNAGLVSMAARDGMLVLGAGDAYFHDALSLLQGTGEVQRLALSERFRTAFDGLPADAPSHRYLDIPLLLESADDVTQVLADHDVRGGLVQGLVNESLDLVSHVETVASATHMQGTDLITETMTRFDPMRAAENPVHGAGLPAPASGELLTYVPADVISFSSRGTVDLVPLQRHVERRMTDEWSWAEDALWAFHVLEAAVDLSIEHDLLSWIGAEHVQISIPARNGYDDGSTDEILLCKVRDPEAARKALERAEAIYAAAAPRLLEGLQGFVRDIAEDFVPEVTLGPADGMFRSLSRLSVQAGPFQASVTYGVLGDLLVVSSSEDGLMSCIMVAAGEEPGLEERPLMAGLLGRDDLSGLTLTPHGRQMAEATMSVQSMGPMLQGVLGGMTSENSGLGHCLDAACGALERIGTAMETVDFLGDGIATTRVLEGGMAHYEREVVHLLAPSERPSAPAAASGAPH